MHHAGYAEVLAEDPKSARDRERQAIERSIDLLNTARGRGATSREAIDALAYVSKLWSIFLEDLGKPGNDLSPNLRAHLISVGIWILRETEEIRTGKSDNFQGLIDVSALIGEGLR